MSSALPLLALLRDGEHDPNRMRLFDLAIAEIAHLETRLAEAERALEAATAPDPRGEVVPMRDPPDPPQDQAAPPNPPAETSPRSGSSSEPSR
jgi:hypothetical protein